MNTCPHPTCDRDISRGEFACRTHWLALPARLRDAITDTWRRRRQTGDPTAHRDAKAAALTWYHAHDQVDGTTTRQAGG